MSWVILSTEAATVTGVSLIGDLLLAVMIGLVSGSVGAVLVSQVFAAADRRRDDYAEAVTVLLSWCEYPYMIRRRVDDQPETLQRLADHGHELQERLARAEAWVTAESRRMGAKYTALARDVKTTLGPLLKEAWETPPVDTPAEMNLNGWGSETCSTIRQQISEFRIRTSRRFSWGRLLPVKE